jgi:hypothetical protein
MRPAKVAILVGSALGSAGAVYYSERYRDQEYTIVDDLVIAAGIASATVGTFAAVDVAGASTRFTIRAVARGIGLGQMILLLGGVLSFFAPRYTHG